VAARKTARTKATRQKALDVSEARLELEAPEVKALAREVEAAGGAPIGAYREPFSGRALLLASLPVSAVEPTPFQRDLSPTHTKRLAQKIEESGSFLDPLIVVRGADGQLWTPNGRHRLAAAKVLGLRQVTALVSADEDLAFRILALNTEKAHNLKDRSLEVIRMARELARRQKRARESEFEAQFEAPELDRFSSKTLSQSLREREGWAARLLGIDLEVKRIVAELTDRGFRSPYLRNYVVARINPVRFHRAKKGEAGPAMAIGAALTRMAASARRFDTGSVRERDLALVAAVSGGGE
jgi:ParB family chromosome partitioning protein